MDVAGPVIPLGKDGEFPRTKLLDEAFFQNEGEVGSSSDVEVGGKEGKTEEVTPALISSGHFPDSWELTHFSPTPKVSTYLIAWANGHFLSLSSSYLSPLTGKTIPMRIYTTYEHIDQAHLALETKKRIMPIYEELFDLAYPLPKLDTLVASDFDAGAVR